MPNYSRPWWDDEKLAHWRQLATCLLHKWAGELSLSDRLGLWKHKHVCRYDWSADWAHGLEAICELWHHKLWQHGSLSLVSVPDHHQWHLVSTTLQLPWRWYATFRRHLLHPHDHHRIVLSAELIPGCDRIRFYQVAANRSQRRDKNPLRWTGQIARGAKSSEREDQPAKPAKKGNLQIFQDWEKDSHYG